jgi:hypothetical protein
MLLGRVTERAVPLGANRHPVDAVARIAVLKGGFHESGRDEYDQTHALWAHAIRGSTSDGRKTRVVVVIIDELLVVTVVGPLK